MLNSWRIGAAVAAVVLLLGGVGAFILKIQHDAYTAGYDKAHQECIDERQKQEAANQNAMNEAAKKAADLAKQLELKGLQLDDVLKGIDLAADQAPGAGSCGIGADSVRRLSTIG